MHPAVEIVSGLLLILYYWAEAIVLFFVPVSMRTLKSVAGEVALVTGGGSGLGRLVALRLSRLGARIVLWDVNKGGIEETRRMIKEEGGEAWTYLCDVAERSIVYDVADRVRRDVGHVTILVNNAGIVGGSWFMDTSDEKLAKTVDVNTTAHFWTLKAFLPHMMETNHGHIVTISSILGYMSLPRLVDYCASKHGAVGLHQSLYKELRLQGKNGIKMTNVCPFVVNTGMFEGVKTNKMFDWAIPMLEPDYVADQIIEATLLNKAEIWIPRSMYFAIPLQLVLPYKAHLALDDVLAPEKMMENFVGRNGMKNGI